MVKLTMPSSRAAAKYEEEKQTEILKPNFLQINRNKNSEKEISIKVCRSLDLYINDFKKTKK